MWVTRVNFSTRGSGQKVMHPDVLYLRLRGGATPPGLSLYRESKGITVMVPEFRGSRSFVLQVNKQLKNLKIFRNFRIFFSLSILKYHSGSFI